MKYFIDTEFIEGFHKPLLGKKRHFIDLVSIGIVCEDGREYYAVSSEFDPTKADDWVKDNVLLPIYLESVNGDMRNRAPFNPKKASGVHWGKGKPNKQIAKEVRNFVFSEKINSGGQIVLGDFYPNGYPKPEFYGYYADYDWVVFCSLFGRMIDLPKGFPNYCRDLKQMMDEKGMDKAWKHKNCPDPEDEHNALADARWNMRLFNKILHT